MGCNHIHALDLAKEGRWDDAHRLVQEYCDERSCLIHGYLHRVEGDLDNAEYWYRRAGGKLTGMYSQRSLAGLHRHGLSGKLSLGRYIEQ